MEKDNDQLDKMLANRTNVHVDVRQVATASDKMDSNCSRMEECSAKRRLEERTIDEFEKIKLYHFTSSEAAADIKSSGFKPGEDGKVWFADHPQSVWGESAGEKLFEVVALKKAILPYLIPVKADEEFDDKTGKWVKSEGPVEEFVYYAVPVQVANSFSRRILPDNERKELMT